MGSTRFGFGSMGMMFGRGGFRGGRGNSGGFHEESLESFQARCNPQAAFTIGAEANEAFKNQFRGMGTRNSVAIRGWGAQPPLKKKAKVPPVRESLTLSSMLPLEQTVQQCNAQERSVAVVNRVLNHHLQVDGGGGCSNSQILEYS